MAVDSGGFGLHSLRASDLEAFRSGIRIKCHILGFERSRSISILAEYAAQAGCKHTLADITPRTAEHQRTQPPHSGIHKTSCIVM